MSREDGYSAEDVCSSEGCPDHRRSVQPAPGEAAPSHAAGSGGRVPRPTIGLAEAPDVCLSRHECEDESLARETVTPARLVSLDGGTDISLFDSAPMIMGRDRRCDARIDSLRVSRFHCCVAAVENGVHVSDLGSTNGTRINGRSIHAGRLLPGDELMIAHLRYRVERGPPGVDR